MIRNLVFLMLMWRGALGLNNGLALTPPMGWLTWERFRCITDCDRYPDECISEALIQRTANLLVSEGYLAAGYNYLGIDDCWLEKQRGEDGKLVPDKKRFPNGMKAVADYIHNKDLKFGLYQDYGNFTCAGYPGVLGHEQLDIDTFVSWDVDYIKLDGCYVSHEQIVEGYPAFGKMLNRTGRPIIYSCSWPAYLEPDGVHPNYDAIAENCNLWRNWDDIDDSWESVLSIMNWFGDNQERFADHAGPGRWNDPDMLIIGNFGLSLDQCKVQMAVWSVMAAPLLISADLAKIRDEEKAVLLNEQVIAIDQDPLGKQGLRVFKDKQKKQEVWTRHLSGGAYAIAFVSTRTDGAPYATSYTLDQIKVDAGKSYEAQDLFDENSLPFRIENTKPIQVRINPTGVKFYKLTPIQAEDSDESKETLKTDNLLLKADTIV